MGNIERIDSRQVPAAREYLTFRLGNEEYGIDILRVQEIRGYEAPTRIANAPNFIKGVVNLRGVIAPIVDLRMRFGCERVDYNGLTVTVILNVGNRVIGAVVDSVSDVLEIPAQSVKPAPEINSAVDARYIVGLGQVGERMLILLDIASLIASPELGLIETREAA
ncbi:chemotaxis protein CheW [Eleftheria terrae]|uniref:chemotaxis protein CheW n=1 Tax=Eleftheria terrae TaxID=1597781 RepID=UPI00263BABC4|nr:chemotaxis protein CheW [Eleftheria terrae]WKB54513.1 chemotaxis protein CheW [Eleftheria terrae]